MKSRFVSIAIIAFAALVTAVANVYGGWWVGYLIGGILALWIRPSLAGLSVTLGWIVGFGADIYSARLFAAARVIAELAGLSGSFGFVIIVLALIMSFVEGWLPALIVHRIRGGSNHKWAISDSPNPLPGG